jgi:hypothetical protein
MPFRLRDDLDTSFFALENVPGMAPELELRFSGGMPSERLDVTFALTPDGAVAASVLDRLGEREARTIARPEPARLALARDAILGSGILRVEATLPLLPPDSVIGELRLPGGGVISRWQFAGDVDQAGAVHDPAPLQLLRAVGPLMALGKEALQLETVNPNLLADAPGPLYIAPADFDLEESAQPRQNVVLYNLRPEPLDIGGFTLRDLSGGGVEIPPGTRIEPHGIFRMTLAGAPMFEAAPMEPGGGGGGGGGTEVTLVDRSGREIARRVYTF